MMVDTTTIVTTSEELLEKVVALEKELEDLRLENKELLTEARVSWYREAYFGESSQ